MKEIVLKEYVEVRRVVAITVDDDCTEQEAAEMLTQMGMDKERLPENVRVVEDWTYISGGDVENEFGVVLLDSKEGE